MEPHVHTQARVGDGLRAIHATKVEVSVVVAVLNLGRWIEELYGALVVGLRRYCEDFEIVFVDDGSTDHTWSVLRKLADGAPRVKVVRMRSSFGEAACFDAGLKCTRGDKVVFLTGRVRVNPLGLHGLLERLDEDYDLVMGWRTPRRDSKFNQVISRLFNWMVKRISKLDLHDINSGIFVARRAVLEEIVIYGNLNIFLPLLAWQKGFEVTEAPIEQLPGSFRQSRYLSEYLQRLLDIITVIFLTKYSKKPLHFLGFFGLIFALIGAGMNLYLFIYRILGMGPIAGRPLLLLGAMLLVIGIQMISIGLIGEMIIFTHARESKEYNIETVIE